MSVELHYECIGAGRPVVVLHGLFGAGRNWLTLARRLAADHAFYLVDLRNHGRSPHTTSMTYLDMAADVRGLLTRLNLAEVILVGHSMGGKVAMTVTLNDPQRVVRLINIDIAPASYPDRFAEMIRAMRDIDLATLRRRAEADELLKAAIPEESVRQFILQNLMFEQGRARWRANLATLQAQMPGILGPLPVAADAHSDIETWFIRGELSDRVGPSHIPLISQLFTNYRIETVAGGGHWPHAEAPTAFMAVFQRALSGTG